MCRKHSHTNVVKKKFFLKREDRIFIQKKRDFHRVKFLFSLSYKSNVNFKNTTKEK